MTHNTQLTHADHIISDKKFPLSIIANNMNSPQNVGSLFRLCDALGVEKLFLCGNSAVPPNPKITRTSRSTEKYVVFEQHDDAEKLIATLKTSGVFIISLEITTASIAFASAEFKSIIRDQKPACLILGAENTGVSEDLLALSDLTTHITMHGNNSSMNVISAASIACFEILQNM